MPCSTIPATNIAGTEGIIPNRAYRSAQANMPTRSIHFTPSRLKKNGTSAMKKISLTMPRECLTCAKPPQGKYMGEITLEGQQVPKKADIIFVMEHSDCNRAIVENLKDLADDIKTEMATKNIDDVKFGVVGYGGAGMLSKAHAHTIDSKLMNSVEKLARAVTNMQDMQMGEGEQIDPLKAVYFAAQYPFRTGASKTIVLLPCDQCRNTM